MKETIPRQRGETIRQELIRLLEGGRLTVSELSRLVGQPEKEIHHHLEELKVAGRLKIVSPECRECGYVFKDRSRPKKPGKCPKCKSTRIEPPLFSVDAG